MGRGKGQNGKYAWRAIIGLAYVGESEWGLVKSYSLIPPSPLTASATLVSNPFFLYYSSCHPPCNCMSLFLDICNFMSLRTTSITPKM